MMEVHREFFNILLVFRIGIKTIILGLIACIVPFIVRNPSGRKGSQYKLKEYSFGISS